MLGNPSAVYWATGTEVPFASFNAATNTIFVSVFRRKIDFTDVIDYCTAQVLEAGCVAHKAEGSHFARDLQIFQFVGSETGKSYLQKEHEFRYHFYIFSATGVGVKRELMMDA